MKNKNQKSKGLRIASETIRKLDVEQLTNIVGGGFTGTQSNNGCASHGGGTTACFACQV